MTMESTLLLLLLCLSTPFLLPSVVCFTPVTFEASTMNNPPLSKKNSSDGESCEILVRSITAQDSEIGSCYAIRNSVFIQEQNVPVEIEMDAYDDTAIHILASFNDEICGAARLLVSESDSTGKKVGKIGRVCVLATHRGRGIGRRIVEFAVEELRRLIGSDGKAILGAQTHALAFYESLGFRLIPGNDYMAAGGVPHRDMELIL